MRRKLWFGVVVAACLAALILPATALGFVTTSSGAAAVKWYWQNPLPQGNSLSKTQFVTDNVGFAAGAAGTFLVTNDAGVTWTAYPTGDTYRAITGLAFLSATDGYITTNDGSVLHVSDPAYASWIPVFQDINLSITDIAAVGSTQWIVGNRAGHGEIWERSGGGSFTQMLPNPVPPGVSLNAVTMNTENEGFAVGSNGEVVRIWPNAGTRQIDAYSLGAFPLYDVASIKTDRIANSTARALIVGAGGRIFRTQNSGATALNWGLQPSTVNLDLMGVQVALDASSKMTGYAVGVNGTVLHGVDDGGTWTGVSNTLTTNRRLNAVEMNGAKAWTVGNEGVVLYTLNGTTWQTKGPNSKRPAFYNVDFVNTTTGFACGFNGQIWKTTNAGKTWTACDTSALHEWDAPTQDNTKPAVYGISMIDATHGYAVGQAVSYTGSGGPVLEYNVMKTVDGNTWTMVSGRPAAGVQDLYSVSAMVDGGQDAVWACGSGGRILVLAAGSWSPMAYTSPALGGAPQFVPVFRRIIMVDANNGWIFGGSSDGLWAGIAHTTDGGHSAPFPQNGNGWNAQTVGGAPWALLDGSVVKVGSQYHGVAVGQVSTILTSTDAGNLWGAVTPAIAGVGTGSWTFRAISLASDGAHGYLAGTFTPSAGPYGPQQEICFTQGGGTAGNSWTAMNPGISGGGAGTREMWGLDALDATHAWGVGSQGTIVSNFNLNTNPPDVPGTFAAAAAGPDKIDLSWSVPSGATQVKIFRSLSATAFPVPYDGVTTPTGFTAVGTGAFAAGTTSFQDSGLTADTTYYYSALAGDADGNWSGAATANAKTAANTIVVPPVTNLHVVAGVASGSAVLTWTNPGLPATQVRVLRKSGTVASTDPNDGSLIATGNVATCNDSGLTNGTTYTYTVFAGDSVPNWSSGVSQSYTPGGITAVTVRRFRNLRTGFYLWSGDPVEWASIHALPAWIDEGIAYMVNPATNTSPEWRFRNLHNGAYLYSADPSEKANIQATLSSTWLYEGQTNIGVSFNPAGSPMWRFRNKRNGSYLWTSDPNEKNNIVATLQATWQLEGVAYYLMP